MKQTLEELSKLEKILENDKQFTKWNKVIRKKLNALFLYDYESNEFKRLEEQLFRYIYHFPESYLKSYITNMYLRCWEAIYLIKKKNNYKRKN